MTQPQFVTTTHGLDRTAPALKLYEQAKRRGAWNPSDLDLAQDILDWQWLKKTEQDLVLRITSLFQAGAEAVTREVLPLIQVVASAGRLEEEMFLATMLCDYAKQVDCLRRVLDQVARVRGELTHYHTENYRAIFYKELPKAMNHLRDAQRASPRAQVNAVVTSNLIVEGVLAETGYHAYLTAFERNGLMPGTCKAIKLLQQDKARHIAYGIYFLSRLIAEDGKLCQVFKARMNKLMTPALGIIGEVCAAYDPVPFGLTHSALVEYATQQCQQHLERVERARGASLDEVARVTNEAIDQA